MNSIKFMIAAYVATWPIHVVYIATLIGDSAGYGSSLGSGRCDVVSAVGRAPQRGTRERATP